MQVSYKNISLFEFDALSSSYKEIEKELEDYSFSSFLQSADLQELSSQNYAKDSDFVSFSNDFTTSLQAYKFRQDEQNILNKENSNTQKSALDELLNQVS